MTTIIVGNTYTLDIEELRNIDLHGREQISSRIDNIRIFLNALVDDILVHHGYLKTKITCYYDYTSFSISMRESYPFLKSSKHSVLFKLDCEIETITNDVIAECVDTCVIYDRDKFNTHSAMTGRAIELQTAYAFFKAIDVIDNAFVFNGELLKKFQHHPFRVHEHDSFIYSIFNIECGGDTRLKADFRFGPFHLTVSANSIGLSCDTKIFSFTLSKDNFLGDIECLRSIFKLFYIHYSGEPVECEFEDFIALFKMKYI